MKPNLAVIDLGIIENCRVIFNEFLGPFIMIIFRRKYLKRFEFGNFELKPKFWILILKDFDFSHILFEIKWGVFPYLHLCFKVNGE